MELELIKRLLEIAATTDESERDQMLEWLTDDDRTHWQALQKRKFFGLVERYRTLAPDKWVLLKPGVPPDFNRYISALEKDGYFLSTPDQELSDSMEDLGQEEKEFVQELPSRAETEPKVKNPRKAGRKGYSEADKVRLAEYLNIPYAEGDQSLKDVWSLPSKMLKQDIQKFGEPIHQWSETRAEVWEHTPWRIHAVFVFDSEFEILKNVDSAAERMERKTQTIVRWKEYCLDTNDNKISEYYKFPHENKDKCEILVNEKIENIKSLIASFGNKTQRKIFYDRYLTIESYLKSDLFVDALVQSNNVAFKKTFPTRIGAVLALYFAFTGLKMTDGGKGTALLNDLSYLLRKSRNIELGKNCLGELREILTSYCYPLIGSEPFVSLKYWRDCSSLLREALENAKNRLDIGSNKTYENLLNEFDAASKIVLNEFESQLKASENHKPLSISNVKALLDRASETSHYVYFRILLQLSTGLRTVEMERLGIKYLAGRQGNRHLLYREVPVGLPLLVSKTVKSKKVSINALSNPKTDTVANIILRHYWHPFDPTIRRDQGTLEVYESEMKDYKKRLKYFWGKPSRKEWAESNHSKLLREDEEFDFSAGEADADIYERRIRATCATMLCYAIESKVCPGNVAHRDAQERLGHIDGSMVASVYAKRRPPHAEKAKGGVDQYFGTSVVTIPNPNYGPDNPDEPKELELNKFESAWSLFLLLEFYERMTKQGDTKIHRYIAEEYVKKAEYVPAKRYLQNVRLDLKG